MRLLITGGIGFIGTNAAAYFLRRGHDVVVLDNFSRPRVEANLTWLRTIADTATARLSVQRGDIRDREVISRLFRVAGPFDGVLHLAAQVAVTTSVDNPREDFEVNALGTINLLEASRCQDPNPAFVYASTNKVYGAMSHLEIVERNGRYEYGLAPHGVSEDAPLDFYSPYGCSKGAADQYVRDYARIYKLPSVVLRQSCIYGPHQFGMEDQGWVAWFAIAAATRRRITIFGDGKQARDLLWVDDLLLAYEYAFRLARERSGAIYNIGGGSQSLVSLLQVIAMMEEVIGTCIPVTFSDWRPGDQRVFTADIRKAEAELGWAPQVLPAQGVRRLIGWVTDNVGLFERPAVVA